MISRAPTAGGQYHWVSEFAPKSWQKSLSYLLGESKAPRTHTHTHTIASPHSLSLLLFWLRLKNRVSLSLLQAGVAQWVGSRAVRPSRSSHRRSCRALCSYGTRTQKSTHCGRRRSSSCSSSSPRRHSISSAPDTSR